MRKRKNLVHCLSLLMVILLVTSVFSGCAKKENDNTVKTEKEKTETKDEKSAETKEKDIVEEPYEIHLFVPGYTGVDNAPRTEKFITAEMEKALNIKVVFEEVPSSAYDEKLSLSLTDGDYPDVYLFNSHTDSNLKKAVDNGIIIPINPYLEGMENLKQYTYETAFNAAKLKNDDNIYLIPRTSVARSDGFLVRKDWMEKCNIKTSGENLSMKPDEFLDMMKCFTTEDPDGDGKDNTFGYIFRANNGLIDPIFTGAFGVFGWQESNGEYKYMNPCYEIGNENYRKVLEFNQKLFQYSHPDSAITTDWHSLLWNGAAGCANEFAGWLLTNVQGLQEINPKGELTYVGGICNESGKLENVANGVGIWGGFAITTACEHPEKVMEMFNWLLSDQGWEYILYGEPGVTYTKDDSGKIIINNEAMKENNRGIYNQMARRAKDGNYFINQTLTDEEKKQLEDYIAISVDTAVFSKDSGKIPEISSDLEFMEIEAKRKETQTKIIMGTMEISEYDKVLTEWYEKGGKTFVEQMNELIDSIE